MLCRFSRLSRSHAVGVEPCNNAEDGVAQGERCKIVQRHGRTASHRSGAPWSWCGVGVVDAAGIFGAFDKRAHNRRFVQNLRPLRRLHHQHHPRVPPSTPNSGAYRSRDCSEPSRPSLSRHLDPIADPSAATAFPPVVPSTANMDQAKLARMQASVRIGMLSAYESSL